MRKKNSLTFLLICLLLMMLVPLAYAPTTVTLYAHSEGIEVGESAYKALKTTECDGPESSIVLKSAAEGLVELGNSSAIVLSTISSQIERLLDATWTFSYYAVANDTDVATLLVDIFLYSSDGDLKATLGEAVAETDLLTTSNATYTGTATITEESVLPTDYLQVEWFANKVDTTALEVKLWLDVAADPTQITGISIPTSSVWNPAVFVIWQVVLPVLFVVGAALLFVMYKDQKVDLHTLVVMVVALYLVNHLRGSGEEKY